MDLFYSEGLAEKYSVSGTYRYCPFPSSIGEDTQSDQKLHTEQPVCAVTVSVARIARLMNVVPIWFLLDMPHLRARPETCWVRRVQAIQVDPTAVYQSTQICLVFSRKMYVAARTSA